MTDPGTQPLVALYPWEGEPLHDDGELDWEALKAGGRLHLYCYLRDSVMALALLDATA